MRKFAVVTCFVLGLVILPGAVQAAPIGLNSCAVGLIYSCDIYVDDETGISSLDASALAPGWLVGYTFLLKGSASLGDGIQEDDVAHALVIHDDLLELYTPTVFNTSIFSRIVSDALGGQAIDNTPLSSGQIVGTPIGSGVTQLNGVGYFMSADSVPMLINWGDIFFGGSDALTVHTALAPGGPVDPAPVPEPGTLSLMVLGGGSALALAIRRRRARTTSQP